MSLNPLPLPSDTPLVQPDSRGNLLINFLWLQAFTTRDQQLAQTTQTITDTTVAGTAAIGATALDIGSNGGLWRVNVIARITQAATTSSSLTPTFRWTTSGVALARTMTAITGNTTSTYSLDVFPVRLDANTALTYETAYASVGATSMTYSLEMAVERLG